MLIARAIKMADVMATVRLPRQERAPMPRTIVAAIDAPLMTITPTAPASRIMVWTKAATNKEMHTSCAAPTASIMMEVPLDRPDALRPVDGDRAGEPDGAPMVGRGPHHFILPETTLA